MSFLDKYAAQFGLDDIPAAIKENLEKVENALNRSEQLAGNTFDDVIKDYVPQIVDIYKRIKDQFSGWKLSPKSILSTFKFVINIANEATQIVNNLENKIVPEGTEPEKAKDLKVAFTQDLTYFVWSMWSPRLIKWLPESLDRYVQKKVVYIVSKMAAEAAFDLWAKINANVTKSSTDIVKAF